MGIVHTRGTLFDTQINVGTPISLAVCWLPGHKGKWDRSCVQHFARSVSTVKTAFQKSASVLQLTFIPEGGEIHGIASAVGHRLICDLASHIYHKSYSNTTPSYHMWHGPIVKLLTQCLII